MFRTSYIKRVAFALLAITGGCSAKDPVTTTPVYHIGTPTNRSSVNSWELNNEPFHTQPGVNGGKSVTLPVIPSQRGFEPDDSIAVSAYNALATDGTIPMRFLSTRAKNGVLVLLGTVETADQKTHAESIARKIPGVKKLESQIRVAS